MQNCSPGHFWLVKDGGEGRIRSMQITCKLAPVPLGSWTHREVIHTNTFCGRAGPHGHWIFLDSLCLFSLTLSQASVPSLAKTPESLWSALLFSLQSGFLCRFLISTFTGGGSSVVLPPYSTFITTALHHATAVKGERQRERSSTWTLGALRLGQCPASPTFWLTSASSDTAIFQVWWMVRHVRRELKHRMQINRHLLQDPRYPRGLFQKLVFASIVLCKYLKCIAYFLANTISSYSPTYNFTTF